MNELPKKIHDDKNGLDYPILFSAWLNFQMGPYYPARTAKEEKNVRGQACPNRKRVLWPLLK